MLFCFLALQLVAYDRVIQQAWHILSGKVASYSLPLHHLSHIHYTLYFPPQSPQAQVVLFSLRLPPPFHHRRLHDALLSPVCGLCRRGRLCPSAPTAPHGLSPHDAHHTDGRQDQVGKHGKHTGVGESDIARSAEGQGKG
jgi:hypothetical protein